MRSVLRCLTFGLALLGSREGAAQEIVRQVGSFDGPALTQFAGVVGVVFWDDGELIVADAGNRRLVRFRADGNTKGSLGREGDGPREFRRIVGFVRCVDGSARIVDGVHQAVTILTRDAQLGERGKLLPEVTASDLVACGPDGDVFVQSRPRLLAAPQPGTLLAPVLVLRIRDSVKVDTLLAAGSVQYHVGSSGFQFMDVPWAPRGFAAVGRQWLYAVDGRSGQVTARPLDGGKDFTWNLKLPIRRMNASTWQAAKEERLSVLREAVRPRLKPLIDEMPAPDQLPLVDQVLVDARDRLWVREFSVSARQAKWRILTPRGQTAGAAILPRNFDVMVVGDGELAGMAVTSEGVEQVRVYRYNLSAPPG